VDRESTALITYLRISERGILMDNRPPGRSHHVNDDTPSSITNAKIEMVVPSALSGTHDIFAYSRNCEPPYQYFAHALVQSIGRGLGLA